MRRRMAFACAVLAMATVISGMSAQAANGGFKTSRPTMLTKMMDGVTITPILSVGDVFGDSGFRFEAIPDGISLKTRGRGRVDLYVNHETSKVPFPFGYSLATPADPTATNGESDFDNSQVSQIALNQNSAGALNGSFVIPSSGGFQRFCSNYLATSKEGFDRDILFTNEESPDYVFRQEELVAGCRGRPQRGGERRRRRSRRGDRGITTRSTGWAGTTTRTTSRSPGSTTWWSCRATTRSRAAR